MFYHQRMSPLSNFEPKLGVSNLKSITISNHDQTEPNEQRNPMTPLQTKSNSRAGRWLSRLGQTGANLLALGAFLALATFAGAQSYTITPLWYATNGIANIANNSNNRGLAYNVLSNQVYVASRNSTPGSISVLDGTSGAVVANNLPGITIAPYNVGVADDGVIYALPLANGVGAAGFKIYAWTNYLATQRVCYTLTSGDATSLTGYVQGQRVGDSFAIYGSGVNTLILLPINSGTSTHSSTNFLLFSTTDGQNFTPTVLAVTGLPASFSDGGPQHGVAFVNSTSFLFRPGTGTTTYLIGFPANFASQGNVVAASVTSSSTALPSGTGSDVYLFSYSPAASLLADYGQILSSAGSTALGLYNISTFPSVSSLGTTNTPHANANGNFTGGVALGGAGKTNALYVLDSNNGVFAFGLTFVPAAVAPVISSAPVGNSVYTNYGPYKFSVTAAGTAPLTYYWQFNSVSNQATATTILASASSSYTISNLTVAASGWYDVIVSNKAGVAISAPVQLSVNTPLVSAYVTNLWSLPADNSQPYLDTGYNTRGLAFDPITMSVLVAEHSAAQIYALDATNGSLKFLITTPQTGLPGGSLFPLGQVGVADDGVVYCCNVSSYNPTSFTAVPGTSDFCLVRFDSVTNALLPDGVTLNPANTFELAFVGDPGANQPLNPGVSSQDRWGDSMAVRGGGTNTEILLGSYVSLYSSGVLAYGTGTGTNVAILTTPDGVSFNATTISVTNAPDGFAYLGVAWGSSNTFWAKSPGYNLRQVQYDLNTGIGWVIQSFATTAGQGSLSSICGIGLDISNNILAGVNTADAPNDLELFQIPSLGFPPESYYQDFFPSYNPNINGNAATTIKYPYIFSLDANNGIIALKYSIPLLPFNILSTTTGNQQILTWQTVIGHTYQLQATNALPAAGNPPWPNVGAPVTVGASGTLSYTNTITPTNALFYRVVAQ